MFTGIIEFIFPITVIGNKLYLYADPYFIGQIKIGHSVCINGICLTVVQINDAVVVFDLTEETISKTNLINVSSKTYANVELALKWGNRVGGHFVTGHVFGVGTILKIFPNGDILFYYPQACKYIKYKASIAVNGVSLTVSQISDDNFRVSLIPQTINKTTFQYLQENDIVNLEFELPTKQNIFNSYENTDNLDIKDLPHEFCENIEENFDNIYTAITAFKEGQFVIVMDDENRENEGDLVSWAGSLTESQLTQMINDTTGIICVPMEENRVKKLGLKPMVEKNTDPNGTAFTVSVDHISCTTGVSSADRLKTIKALCSNNTLPHDLRKPGHVFPLVSNSGGLTARKGHTEAVIALCKLANLYPFVGVIGELKNTNGTMKRRRDCFIYAKKWGIPIINIEQIMAISIPKSKLLADCEIRTKIGEEKWHLYCFDSGNYNQPHKVLTYGEFSEDGNEIVTLRIHSECFTGDVLYSLQCDCGEQLLQSMQYIVNIGKGLIIFPAEHEGRGIGLVEKIKAYNLQSKGCDTFTANNLLGFESDIRNYDIVSYILEFFSIKRVNLLSDNPHKIVKEVVEIIPLPSTHHPQNTKYLSDKSRYFENIKKFRDTEITSSDIKEVFPNMKIIPFREYKIAIIHSSWHILYISRINIILQKHLGEFSQFNPSVDIYSVPGSNEIPFLASKIAKKYDGIICVGILIKGETLHFENVSTAVSNGIMQAQISTGIPMMNCILSCLNFAQLEDRISGPKSTLKYIVDSMIDMINKNE